MLIDELVLDDIITVVDRDNIGYETHPIFPRVLKSKWKYQDISKYKYEFQHMFNGKLITHFCTSREDVERYLREEK